MLENGQTPKRRRSSLIMTKNKGDIIIPLATVTIEPERTSSGSSFSSGSSSAPALATISIEEEDDEIDVLDTQKEQHKIAERKRRRDMKELFEELRACLPSSGKLSKWEVLEKAVDFIDYLTETQAELSKKKTELLSNINELKKIVSEEINSASNKE